MSLDLFTQGLPVVAATPVAGFALQNATPTILTWTAPNDGNFHVVQVFFMETVQSAMTGGKINLAWTAPDGTACGYTIDGGGNAPPQSFNDIQSQVIIKANTTFSILQVSALTAGAAICWLQVRAA